MSHPEFFELTFDGRQAPCQAGLQRAASPLPGAWGCAPLLFPSRAACGGARKKGKKGFSGIPRTPAEGGCPLHSRFFEFLFQKFGMTHELGRNLIPLPTDTIEPPDNKKKEH